MAAKERFLRDALEIFEQAENVKVRACKVVQEDNYPAIGFVPSAEVNLLPKVLPLSHPERPGMHTELVSPITTEQGEKILSGELDADLVRHPVHSLDLDYLELTHEPLVVVLPMNHPLANEQAISAEQLHGVNFISTDSTYSGVLTMIVKNQFQQQKSQPSIVQVATNILVTMNLVDTGLRATLISGYMNNFSTG